MSNFTTTYDAIRTELPLLTGFSSKTEVYDPYDLSNNPEHVLRDGFGVRISESSTSPFQEFKDTRELRTFDIILTSEVRTTDHNRDPLIDQSKAIIEDGITVRIKFENVEQLSVPGAIEQMTFAGSSGIDFIILDKKRFIFTTVSFTVSLRELL